jgi:lipopolysaccharide transport system ATP-binding protein
MAGGGKATSFRELLTQSVSGLFGAARQRRDSVAPREFWALEDVSFTLREGTRLGIIGRNGAGKSTLLKMLSRITEPSAGKIEIYGRTASLLEIGTGFHPELTGRENIYLNGALLGMGRAEIRRKLDQIVDFAEMEKFLDDPVKHYSSGMYIRLAFSIAAHVDPDILILDEVLAVGDIQFQRKCFGKMEELGQTARSVIFVSHDLAAVSSLCNRCIVLDTGRLVFDGSPAEGIAKYYEANTPTSNVLDLTSSGRSVGDMNARLLSARVVDESGNALIESEIESSFKVKMRYWLSGALRAPAVPNFHFYRADGTCAFVAVAPDVKVSDQGEYVAEVTVPGSLLNEGMYSIGLALTSYPKGSHVVHFYEQKALTVNVRDPRDSGSLRYGFAGEFPGAVRPRLNWTIGRVER